MILVTGGLGYLGVTIVEHLLSLGLSVRLASHRENPLMPEKLVSCECFMIDLNDIKSLEGACYGIKTIIHLAALDAGSSEKNPASALIVNGLGTLNLLKVAGNMGVENFVYMSTVHVYGSPLQGFIDENSIPRPIHPYSITHKVAEDYVLEANAKGILNGVVFRLSNAVGSPDNGTSNAWKLVVNDLCKQAILNKSMNLVSNRGTLRDFLSMVNVSNSIVACLENKHFFGEIFNLSSGISINLERLTDIISLLCRQSFDFDPHINFMHDETDSKALNSLIISNNKLKNAGVNIQSDISEDIKKILFNCEKWFQK